MKSLKFLCTTIAEVDRNGTAAPSRRSGLNGSLSQVFMGALQHRQPLQRVMGVLAVVRRITWNKPSQRTDDLRRKHATTTLRFLKALRRLPSLSPQSLSSLATSTSLPPPSIPPSLPPSLLGWFQFKRATQFLGSWYHIIGGLTVRTFCCRQSPGCILARSICK